MIIKSDSSFFFQCYFIADCMNPDSTNSISFYHAATIQSFKGLISIGPATQMSEWEQIYSLIWG